MTNYCSNTLCVSPKGSCEAALPAMEKFGKMLANAASGKEGLFQQTLPLPEVGDNTSKWGVGRDAEDVYVSENSEQRIVALFETAWSAPEAWLAAMRETYPTLIFQMSFDAGTSDVGGDL